MFQIKTKRLILRDLLESDLNDMYKLGSDERVIKHMEFIKFDSVQKTKDWLLESIKNNKSKPRNAYILAITEVNSAEFIGWIGIGKPSSKGKGDLDFGYALLPEFWGKGYASEALAALLNYCIELPNVNVITGDCDIANVGSKKVMEKAGMYLLCYLDKDDNPTQDEAKYDGIRFKFKKQY